MPEKLCQPGDMLISEQLFLLLTRDDGKVEAMSMRGYGVAAGIVTDLVMAERLDLSEHKDPRVHVIGSGPVGHLVLDTALEHLTHKKDGRRLSSVVTDSRLNLEHQIAEGFAERGIVSIEEKRLLGLVPARYPMIDSRPEERIRDRLRDVLAGIRDPEPADATILAVLQGLGVARKVLKEEAGGLSSRALKKRIEEVAARNPAGQAVKRAVDAMNTAIMTSTMIAAGAATSSS